MARRPTLPRARKARRLTSRPVGPTAGRPVRPDRKARTRKWRPAHSAPKPKRPCGFFAGRVRTLLGAGAAYWGRLALALPLPLPLDIGIGDASRQERSRKSEKPSDLGGNSFPPKPAGCKDPLRLDVCSVLGPIGSVLGPIGIAIAIAIGHCH